MRIAYGIHGYGRGHSSRALAVLPELASRHELLIFAGGNAYDALSGDYPICRLPVFRYELKKNGRRSKARTLLRGATKLLDLYLHGPALEMTCEALADFQPDAVLSDSEPWTHWAARRLGLPRISFDHYAVLLYCDWPMSPRDRRASRREAFFYRRMMAGDSDRYVIVSFYAPPPKREGVCVVGPVLRDIVREATPARGDYLLVYFSNGQHHFTPRIEAALRALDEPVVVYGTGREGVEGRLGFRPPSNTKFVEDLAASRAVFATAGNQLISEAVHLRKPLLLMPEDCLEQRLNATVIERMGIGMRTHRNQVSVKQLRAFLDSEPTYLDHFPDSPGDGQSQAVAAIERFAEDLAARGAQQAVQMACRQEEGIACK